MTARAREAGLWSWRSQWELSLWRPEVAPNPGRIWEESPCPPALQLEASQQRACRAGQGRAEKVATRCRSEVGAWKTETHQYPY